jgi:nucleotide-binding universal stress UspA family protein
MDRILVATDFSPRSDRALRRATLIARRVGASLSLVHVVDVDRPERLIASDRAAASSFLEELTETIATADGIPADHMVKVDDVYSGILDAADESGAELIILGPHRTRFTDAFIGTTVERVLRRTRLPLLVAVHSPAASYDRTLLALDFDEASKSAARAALKMGIFDHTEVIVMHAFDTPAEGMMRRAMETAPAINDYVATERSGASDRLQGLVRELGLPPSDKRVAAIKGSPARTILESAQSQDSHLIVLGTNQRKGFERLLIGSVTEDVIRDAHRDILIIPVEGSEVQ